MEHENIDTPFVRLRSYTANSKSKKFGIKILKKNITDEEYAEACAAVAYELAYASIDGNLQLAEQKAQDRFPKSALFTALKVEDAECQI